MRKKKILILIVAACLYVGLFAYGMYNKYRTPEDTTDHTATIPTETHPSVLEITQDNFYDYFYLDCDVLNFNKTSDSYKYYFSDKEYWSEDGTAELQISIGQKAQGKINNVTILVEAWSETNTWKTEDPYTENIIMPITGVITKTILVESNSGLFERVSEPVFEIRIVAVKIDRHC